MPPLFNKGGFVRAFAGSHLSVARFSDPNIRRREQDVHDVTASAAQDVLGVQNAQQVFNPNVTGTMTMDESILPQWETYNIHNVEMVFDKTPEPNEEPNIRPLRTDPALLRRCR